MLKRRPTARLRCEALEARDVPATFYPTTANELVAAVASANGSTDADTIVLATGATYTLTAVNSTHIGDTYIGRTGLPVVAAAGGPLTVVGNGAVIERSTATGTPAFRLLAVEGGASLTAENLTVQNGRIEDSLDWIANAAGGAVLNLGAAVLRDVTVQNNAAVGWRGNFYSGAGGTAAGGGVFSDGNLTITGGSVRNNQAVGGDSGRGDGAPGLGGGLFITGGTATLTGVTLADNTAKGGGGGDPYWFYPIRGPRERRPAGKVGTGAGGGLYARNAAVTLASCTVSGNKAVGGESYGGGIYVGFGATVDWDSATRFSRNKAGVGNDFYRS